MDNYIENILNLKYCFNTCYEKNNLSLYKDCIIRCQSFRNKKLEFIDYYLDQIESLISGKESIIKARGEVEDTYNRDNNKKYLIDKYIFKDYYYQSNPMHEVGVPNTNDKSGASSKRN